MTIAELVINVDRINAALQVAQLDARDAYARVAVLRIDLADARRELRAARAVERANRPTPDPRKVAAGKAGGAVGGFARAASLSPERRSEIARLAVAARERRAHPDNGEAGRGK